MTPSRARGEKKLLHRMNGSGAMPFHDAIGGDAAPSVRDRQSHCGLGQIGQVDSQGGKIHRLRQTLQVNPSDRA